MKYYKSESLNRYFQSIRYLDPLTKEEELKLAEKVQKGNRKAIHKLIKHNLKIVVTIANKNIGRGILVDDLIQQGNLGLWEAAFRFEAKHNVRFATFAGSRVLKSMNSLIDTCGRIVRIPVNQEYKRYLAIKAGKDVDNLNPLKLDDLVSDDNKRTHGDTQIISVDPKIDDYYDNEDSKSTVATLLDNLKERDRIIIKLYFGIDEEEEMPTRDIANKVGLTQIRICQIIKSAKEKLAKQI